MMVACADTFKMDPFKEVMTTGAQVAATICLSGSVLALTSVDVFSLKNG